MSEYDYDLLVIGAGSAGVRCARVAAQLGAGVVVVESRYLGGTCINVGCVPKKLFVYASQFRDHFAAASGFGWSVSEPRLDWQLLRDAKNEEIQRLNRVYESLLDKAGVSLVRGEARIVDPHRVVVGARSISAQHIVIATGGWPRKGSYRGAQLTLSSNEVFYLEELPKRVLIEGGGYIAVEFAGIFNGLGCEVELVYRGKQFLRGFDQDVRDSLAEQMREKGISLRFATEINCVSEREHGVLEVLFNDGCTVEYDKVLSAIGRCPMTENLGLEAVGVRTHPSGTVVVNDHLQTSVPSIYALGDVVGRFPLTPVAIKEGMALAQYLFEHKPIDLDYRKIATAVFSCPEVATVGMSEEVARETCSGDVQVYKSSFRPLKHTLSGLPEKSLMKLVVRKSDQRVLGCHIVGEGASEIMQGVAIAINMGATKQDFDQTVAIHPTSAEELVTMR